MASEQAKKTLEKLEHGRYQNSRQLDIGGIPFTAKEVFIKAPLIAGTNNYLIGAAGRGKSQICYDLKQLVGDGYCYIEGRPDFEPSELLKQVRLDRLKDVSSDRELVELTENIRKAVYYIEELNRAPPIIQNYLFNFFDGKIAHLGDLIPLGRIGYSLGFASGNLGNGAYVGVSDSDRALKDRMHMIVNLGYPDFRPTPHDMFKVYGSKKNPRADLPENTSSCLEELVALHDEFGEREVPSIIPILGVYFSEGLDYLENTPKHSKLAIEEKWPRVDGIKSDSDEAQIFPLSPRAVFGAIALSQALEMIAESSGKKVENSVSLFLDSLRFTVPYSGVLSQEFVYNKLGGDAYSAFDAVLGKGDLTGGLSRNREQINNKLPLLEEAVYLAESGIKDSALLDEIADLKNPAHGKWYAVRETISKEADERKQNPSKETVKLREIIEKAKKAEDK